MKKIIGLSLLIVTLLTACGVDTEENLKSNTWNVVATNGEAYTAEFANDTATFKMGEFLTVGMHYEINDDEITLIEEEQEGQEEHTFIIEKNKEEYLFKAKTDEVKERFGDLTLSPLKK